MDFETFVKEAELVKFPASMTIDELIGENMGYVVDPDYLPELLSAHSNLFVYTLVEDDEIIPGCAFINRIGYLFGKKQVNAEVIRFE